MAITQYYVDPAIAGDSGTGTIGDPYGDLQYALDQITRDATNGDQINIKAGTAEVLAAALSLATYGSPVEDVPLILRGYTSTANDGGMAEIDCGGFTMWADAGYDYIQMIHLEMHSPGNNSLINLGSASGGVLLYECEIHKGVSSPTSKTLAILGYSSANLVIGCYIHDAGTGGVGVYPYNNCIGNYITDCEVGIRLLPNAACAQNIISVPVGGTGIRLEGDSLAIFGNTIYSDGAGTGSGITYTNSSVSTNHVFNNLIVGFSGAGGVGINLPGSDSRLLGHNAFYNNTSDYSVSDVYVDLRANDVALAADPFTDAANGDFSLTEAAQTALRSLGWPPSYLGAAAATDPHITIGPLQYGPTPAASGGGGRRRRLWVFGG